jgi:hypothetical protein
MEEVKGFDQIGYEELMEVNGGWIVTTVTILAIGVTAFIGGCSTQMVDRAIEDYSSSN